MRKLTHAAKYLLGLILVLMMVPMVSLAADDGSQEVQISSENFPDKSFRSFLREYDFDGNKALSEEEISRITELCAGFNEPEPTSDWEDEPTEYDYLINDPEGIQYLTNLKYLELYKCGITQIDLSQNTKLETLVLFYNNIQNLDLSKNTALHTIDVTNNNMQTLNLSTTPNAYLRTTYRTDNMGSAQYQWLQYEEGNSNLQILVNGNAYTPQTISLPTNKLTGKKLKNGATILVNWNGKKRNIKNLVTMDSNTMEFGKLSDLVADPDAGEDVAEFTVFAKDGYRFEDGSYKMNYSLSIDWVTPKLKISAASKTVKYSAVRKKSTYTSAVKVSGVLDNAKTYYYKVGGSSKLSINKKTGKILVKKKTRKGTYKIKVKARTSETLNCWSATKYAWITVKVK